MNQTWMIILVSLLLLIGVGLLIARIFWIKKQNERFSRLFKLIPSGKYNAPIFTGIYRRYQLAIQGFFDERKKNKHTLTKIAIKMQNPNKKYFVLYKNGKTPLPSFLPLNHADAQIIQSLPGTVDGITNDILMCNLIFTEDIKRQIDERMREINSGAVYLYGEELGVVSPIFVGKEESYEIWAKQMDLICDIKDAFQ